MRIHHFRLMFLALLLLAIASCRPGFGNAGHDDGDEGKTAQITIWMSGYEVFTEHQSPVVNKATTFITHITDLGSLEPRTNGMVKFILRQGETVFEHPQAAPARAGIYLPGIIFPGAGDWEMSLVIPAGGTNATVDLGKVRAYQDENAAAQAEMPEPPEGINFLKEQQWNISAGTEPVVARELVEQLRLPAVVSARPGSLAQVTLPVPGRLVLPPGKPMPVVGDRVEEDQVLAIIQPSFSEIGGRLVRAEGEVVRSKLALEQAELALQRVEKLARVEAKSGRELQEAQFGARTARAVYEAALGVQAVYRQASTNFGEDAGGSRQPVIELRSPISGTIVSQPDAAVGEYVAAERALFTVLDPEVVFVEARVPESSVRRLGAAMTASYKLPWQPETFIPITVQGGGRLVFVGMQVDAATRTVPLIYEVKNPDNLLRVGQSLDLFVETSRHEKTLAIPSAAIVEEDGHPIAFVQVAGETFQKRDLTLGIRDKDWVQVLSGIQEGERVVTKGAYAVRLASVSSAIPAHGHVH
jgi:membrane fusion protein, heavy metal efflux system